MDLELNETVHVWLLLVQNLFFFSQAIIDWNIGPGASIRKGPVLENEVLVRTLRL